MVVLLCLLIDAEGMLFSLKKKPSLLFVYVIKDGRLSFVDSEGISVDIFPLVEFHGCWRVLCGPRK